LLGIMLALAGCKKDGEKEAIAEAAQARMELVKAKAEAMGLKGEVSYLREKLLAANQARDILKQQVDELLEDHNSIATESQNAEVEIEGLKAKLAEQTRKANELEKQIEQLKAIAREFQAKVDQQKNEEQPTQKEAPQ